MPFRRNKKPPIHKTCPSCSVKYTVRPSGIGRKYCSRRCAGIVKTKENNPNWRGGKTGQDTEERNRFNRELRSKVFARDNYTCQICLQTGDYLQADHIKRWSEYPELRFKLDNCRTLCMACHYYVTFKRKMPTGMIWGKLPRALLDLD